MRNSFIEVLIEFILKIATTFAMMLLFMLVYAAVFGFIAAWLWNMIIPDMFGLPETEWWQMFVFMILLRLLLPNINVKNDK